MDDEEYQVSYYSLEQLLRCDRETLIESLGEQYKKLSTKHLQMCLIANLKSLRLINIFAHYMVKNDYFWLILNKYEGQELIDRLIDFYLDGNCVDIYIILGVSIMVGMNVKITRMLSGIYEYLTEKQREMILGITLMRFDPRLLCFVLTHILVPSDYLDGTNTTPEDIKLILCRYDDYVFIGPVFVTRLITNIITLFGGKQDIKQLLMHVLDYAEDLECETDEEESELAKSIKETVKYGIAQSYIDSTFYYSIMD